MTITGMVLSTVEYKCLLDIDARATPDILTKLRAYVVNTLCAYVHSRERLRTLMRN